MARIPTTLKLEAERQFQAAFAECMRESRWAMIFNHPFIQGVWEVHAPDLPLALHPAAGRRRPSLPLPGLGRH